MRYSVTDSTDRVEDQPETTGSSVAPMTAELLGDVDELGELAWADPATLVLEVNTRTDVHLDPHFCASIRDRGVREPINVYARAADGALVVRKGQRRTLAAVKAGLARVRVLVEPQTPVTDAAAEASIDPAQAQRVAEAERIIDQLGENQHRAGISDADEVAAHQQLLGLGMTAGQIARTTRTPAKRVRQTTAVARSARALEVGSCHDLDLVQMAVIAEFADDDTAVEQLTETALTRPGQLAHQAQRLRDERADRARCTAVEDQLRAAGVTVLGRDDDRMDTASSIARLRPTADDPQGTDLTEQAHRDCPGHAATVMTRWDFEQAGRIAQTVWMCLAPIEHGHAELYDRSQPGITTAAPVDETDEQRQARENREREAARQERRTVIANNKAWDSAQVVRRDWLRELFTRKAAPKGAAIFVAAEIARGDHDLRRAMESRNALAATLLGFGDPSPRGVYGFQSDRAHPIAEAAGTSSAARATMLSLAVVLAAYEEGTHRNSWRNPSPATRRYVTQLREWGYDLSDVEQLVITEQTDATPRDATVPDPTTETDSVDNGGVTDSADEVAVEDQAADTTEAGTAATAEGCNEATAEAAANSEAATDG
ncbi:ParB N-terminal domain-containing protein [Pseudonocardia alni]|uniref:ParB N-terminal domain-containing protein n=1 Tax=Pseudonocardia alni TaxID=33907 RepID=UPI00368A3C3B